MAFFKHQTAIVESPFVGEGTAIQAFAHVLGTAQIGRDCEIADHTFIDDGVTVGDRVTVQCGVQLWNGARLEDDVYIGPNATFSNDAFPRSKRRADRLPTVVKRGASIGAGATILAGITVGEHAMVGSGSVVTQDVPRNAVVSGNPARIVSYADIEHSDRTMPPAGPTAAAPSPMSVEGVVLQQLPLVEDMRSMLSFAEAGRHIPFAVKRYFLVFKVSSEQVRGEHAHREQHQFLVCVHGRCSTVADDGVHRQEILLDSPNIGLYLPPMTWAVQYKYSSDAVLMVLSSAEYDPADYIREYSEFLALKGLR